MNRLQAIRHVVQIFFLATAIFGVTGLVGMTGLIYPYYFCYSCPYAWASCPLGILQHAFIDMRTLGLIEGLRLLVYLAGVISLFGLAFGRFICGWACPIGALQDLLGGIRMKVFKKEVPRLYPLRFVKYGVLLAIPITSYAFIEVLYTRLCPVGGITGTFPTLILDWGGWVGGTDFPIKIASVLIFFALVLAVFRGWCRYICPLGAMLSPFNKATPLNIHVNEKACVNCGLCSKACPMKIDVPASKRSLECIGCARCVGACKNGSARLRIFGKEVA